MKINDISVRTLPLALIGLHAVQGCQQQEPKIQNPSSKLKQVNYGQLDNLCTASSDPVRWLLLY